MKVKVVEVVSYGGHSISANGSVNVTFKAGYSELSKSVMMLQTLNCDVTLKARCPNHKGTMELGMFRLKDVNVHHDGCSVLKFNGLADYIELDNLNNLLLTVDNNDVDTFLINASAEIEEEEEEQ